MYLGFPEEGDRCPKCHAENLESVKAGSCSCHIHPPCSACVDAVLTCKGCGWEDDSPDHKDVPVAPGLLMREYKPKPLDPNKISFRTKMHTHFSQIQEGIYPEGTTREQVLKVVKGTFGGRFTRFGGGHFQYVAYTD